VAKSEAIDDMNSQHKSIKEVIELQADLTEVYGKSKLLEWGKMLLFFYCRECEQLLDQCMAQQRSFEAQLELNRIKQERRLEKTDRNIIYCRLITLSYTKHTAHSIGTD
jgi:vacuolar-type H+-ATPase subunit B/Vma2